mmetsp:Transcript_23169/g.34709  ORF Transcript_23169/g.34709 Transcript_23169/m.34709 type:complete len:145 (-) Transcript_23169:39-473(-)
MTMTTRKRDRSDKDATHAHLVILYNRLREKKTLLWQLLNTSELFHLKSKGEGLGVHLRSTGEFKARQVFLGGSCNPTSWRKDVAIPAFEKADISYYNPQVERWTRDLIPKEAKAKADALCLLFVIDNATRANSSILRQDRYNHR